MSGGSQIFFGAATPACWTVIVLPASEAVTLCMYEVLSKLLLNRPYWALLGFLICLRTVEQTDITTYWGRKQTIQTLESATLFSHTSSLVSMILKTDNVNHRLHV